MPRYFFNVRDGRDLPDSIGTDLVDDAAAKIEAVQAASGMLGDVAKTFWDHGEWTMRVTDETDRQVCTLHITGESFHKA